MLSSPNRPLMKPFCLLSASASIAGIIAFAITAAISRLSALLSVIGRVRAMVFEPSFGKMQRPPRLNSLGGGGPCAHCANNGEQDGGKNILQVAVEGEGEAIGAGAGVFGFFDKLLDIHQGGGHWTVAGVDPFVVRGQVGIDLVLLGCPWSLGPNASPETLNDIGLGFRVRGDGVRYMCAKDSEWGFGRWKDVRDLISWLLLRAALRSIDGGALRPVAVEPGFGRERGARGPLSQHISDVSAEEARIGIGALDEGRKGGVGGGHVLQVFSFGGAGGDQPQKFYRCSEEADGTDLLIVSSFLLSFENLVGEFRRALCGCVVGKGIVGVVGSLSPKTTENVLVGDGVGDPGGEAVGMMVDRGIGVMEVESECGMGADMGCGSGGGVRGEGVENGVASFGDMGFRGEESAVGFVMGDIETVDA